MTLEEFRGLVHSEFGPNLEHMTPANVREFLDRFQSPEPSPDGRIRLSETQTSYEGILRDFFRQVLDLPPDEAVIPLWTLALELSFAGVREVLANRLDPLFGSLERPESA